MEITLIGFACFAACFLVMMRPIPWGFVMLGLFTPMKAAAAINLWSLGGTSILCSQIVVIALAISILIRPRFSGALYRFATSHAAVLILALFLTYAVFSAVFMPRLFAGDVQIYSLDRITDGSVVRPLTPLQPSLGNITQSAYLASGFVIFALVAFVVSQRRGAKRAALFFNAATITHIVLGELSLIPGGEIVLEFFRTANYAILDNHYVAGMRRLIGGYPEASEFGGASVVFFTYNAVRYAQTRGVWYLFASVVLLGFVVLSFATTAYAAIGVMSVFWFIGTMASLVGRGLKREDVTAIIVTSFAAFAAALLFLWEPARVMAVELWERLFGSKLLSESGIERSRWNTQGLQSFVDTFGLGVGLGSTRTSSIFTALLSNVGIVGTGLFTWFLFMSFLRPWPRRLARRPGAQRSRSRRMFHASGAAALAALVGTAISSGNVDPGALFFVCSGVSYGALVGAKRKFSVKRRSRALAPAHLYATNPYRAQNAFGVNIARAKNVGITPPGAGQHA